MSRTRILGISAFYHDAAAVLVEDGKIVAAAQEERFTRVKGDPTFPHHAISYCLEEGEIQVKDVNHVVFYENHLVKFDRLVQMQHLAAPHGLKSYLAAMPKWLTQNLWLENLISRELGTNVPITFCDHHLSHAASAFFPSPFEEAAILTVDGVGEWSTTVYGTGRGNRIELLKEIRFPNSLGLLYSAFTFFTGFKINSGEYKLMGLAPYGRPIYADRIMTELIDLHEDGSLAINQNYFDYVGGLTMTNVKFNALFDGPPRRPEGPITCREMDIAASIQEVLNCALLKMARHVRSETGMKRLVLAGGVALNVVAIGKLHEAGIFDGVWVQPAAGDAGGALGAALWLWHMVLGQARQVRADDSMSGAFLGPNIRPESDEDEAILKRLGAVWEALPSSKLQKTIAALVAKGSVVAIARGRMEWGPRALGARSILADARSPEMQSHLNQKIKFREGFRPFAPMVLRECASQYFAGTQESPYMLMTHPVLEKRRRALSAGEAALIGFDSLKVPRSDIPAVTHVDYSARVQTVDNKRNPFMHGVLTEFQRLTGCPVMINTSFNVRGEPIVCTVEDAYRCFMATDIDVLVVGDRILYREKQRNRPLNDAQRAEWLRRYELD